MFGQPYILEFFPFFEKRERKGMCYKDSLMVNIKILNSDYLGFNSSFTISYVYKFTQFSHL